MLTLEEACKGLGVGVDEVLGHRVYADRVVLVVKDGRKLTYRPAPPPTEVVTAIEPERAPGKRKARMSADIKVAGSETLAEQGDSHV